MRKKIVHTNDIKMIINILSETVQVRKQWSGFSKKAVESINPQFYMRKIFSLNKVKQNCGGIQTLSW